MSVKLCKIQTSTEKCFQGSEFLDPHLLLKSQFLYDAVYLNLVPDANIQWIFF